MEPSIPLQETLQRLDVISAERGLDRSDLLSVTGLASATALPEVAVRTLLQGGSLPADTVNDRVRTRIRMLAEANLQRTGRKMAALAAEVAQLLGRSEMWARRICDGTKMPNVEDLHGIADFFQVNGGEAFFTAPADQALNRALLSILNRLESPQSDPVKALMEKYGVRDMDLRRHGTMSPEALERVLAGVIQSVYPAAGEASR
ncbi:hypothetical protein [Streptomyces viridochromogenes]|uniref:hypothetical protein n=1 Tax=Streptomyces viridochromogenes TaxID=1938 RepID=UPI0031E241B1